MQALEVRQTPVAHQIDELGVPNLTIAIDVLVAVLAWPPRLKNRQEFLQPNLAVAIDISVPAQSTPLT